MDLLFPVILGILAILNMKGRYYSLQTQITPQVDPESISPKILKAFYHFLNIGEIQLSPDRIFHNEPKLRSVSRRQVEPSDLRADQEERGSIFNYFSELIGYSKCSGTIWFIVFESGEIRGFFREDFCKPVVSSGFVSTTRVCVGRSLEERLREEISNRTLREEKIIELVLVSFHAKVFPEGWSSIKLDITFIEGVRLRKTSSEVMKKHS